MNPEANDFACRFGRCYTGVVADPDFAEMFAPTVTVWHNYDAKHLELPGPDFARGMMWKVRGCSERLVDFSDTIDHLHVTDSAIIIAATATGTMPDGSRVNIPRCLIMSLQNGLISAIHSYGDHAQSAPLDALLPYEEMFAAIAQVGKA